MSIPTETQIIRDMAGHPAFAVIPYQQYLELTKQHEVTSYVPNEVVRRVIVEQMSPVRAWREHLELTQTEMAKRLNISQSAYAQQENKKKLRKSSREKIARALKINEEQLHF